MTVRSLGVCLAGDRYLLKLFRDFVFHQSREDGSPVLDWGHVVECLNKLDAGLPEKVQCARQLPRCCPPLPCMHPPSLMGALTHSGHCLSHTRSDTFIRQGRAMRVYLRIE